jgi:hypothetical protein
MNERFGCMKITENIKTIFLGAWQILRHSKMAYIYNPVITINICTYSIAAEGGPVPMQETSQR